MAHHDTLIQPRMLRRPPFTVEASGYEPVEGETIPRRNPIAKDKLISRPEEDIATIHDILLRGARLFGNAKCVGSRRIIETHEENKKVKKLVNGVEQEVDKKWTYFELTGYEYLTFVEFQKHILNLGSGLRKLGLGRGNRLHIYAATR